MKSECRTAAQAGQVNSNGCYCFGFKFQLHQVLFSVLSALSLLSFCYV